MIVFSHGFGVDKTDRGLFSDIADALGQKHAMFDYNDVSESGKAISVSPIDQQVMTLQKQLSQIDEPINLICHSQGCLTPALLDELPINVESILFLAPAMTTTSDDFIMIFSNRPGTTFSKTSNSTLERKDGTKTTVPPDYWPSLDAVGNVDDLYAQLAAKTELTIILAGHDEVLGSEHLPKTEKLAEIHTMKGADHNFTGASRAKLLAIFQRLAELNAQS